MEPAIKKFEKWHIDAPAAVLLGPPGAGKTTIYNELCNTSHPAEYSEAALTAEVRVNKAS